jgi:hypothetical protein
MQISVALDGSKRRDLSLFQGDEVTITAVVYAEDGDTTPITPTDIRFAWPESGVFAYGESFVVSDENTGRTFYRLVGEVDGVTTTLAYGYITVEGLGAGWLFGFPADGYWVAP